MTPNLNLTQLTKENYHKACKIREDVPLHLSDLADLQIIGIFNASDLAGEYLDSLGKSDLALLSVDEWQTLLRVVVLSYHDTLVPYSQHFDIDIPALRD